MTEPTGVQRTVLGNGLTVVSEFMPGVRSVSIGAWVRIASVHEPRPLMGVSHLLEHMVFKGTRRRSAKDIAMSLENLGGSLDAYTSREHTAFQARVLDEHLVQAADVLGDLIFSPALRESDLQLERKVVLEEIAMVDDTPDDLVFELHNELLWGEHPYGYSILGTRDTVASLGVADLRALHGRGYQPRHIVVAAAGNVEHERLLEALRLTGWEDVARGDDDPAVPPAPVAAPPGVRHVERDGAQTQIVFGVPTVRYGDPRRYAVSLASTLLGGGMSSRLFQRVREEMGLAYSVSSFHSYHTDSGTHGVYLATSPETAKLATDAVHEEMRAVAEQGFTAEEVAAGRGQLKGQITLSLESSSSRMYRAAATELYGEPYRPIDDVLSQIDAIRDEEVAAMAAAYFVPELQTVLSLGPGPGTA
ncbi:MAG: insulinase family protein [Gemmatimonadetes bacterium]|jgi:predicted Zn-dependent peptidase|nr:insulinase family protein [Gemmatimonadota bacterium]MBK6455720.1 insulinase family protein [Gemmatimonadota bacterium]MBK6841887.1 insulinase family protein [Gemmatimonadota bacterium]MBK7835591.1 insulinase family protein [Gemmatimonadota bacterium]MBK8061984.1 insulinase family protein [Gemmatimonadota bacterium]